MINLLLPRRSALGSDRSPTSDFWFGGIRRPTESAIDVTEDVALTYSAVWAATRLLAGTIGWLPLNLYRSRQSQGRRGRDLITDDNRHEMVHRRPNIETQAMMWRSAGANQQINHGNSYAEIQRVAGRAVALWPIHHSRVTPKRDEDSRLVYLVRNNNGTTLQIPSADMLHVSSQMTRDGITGLGVIEFARESIGLGLATERHGANYFGHGGLPRIIVTHPQKLSKEARDNFRKEWKEIYSGSDGSSVGLLHEGAQAERLSISAEDSQFLGTRQHNVEEIARWYGVPPHLLQHLLRATYSNIEHQGIDFVVYALIPWLKLWEQELTIKLLTERERMSGLFFEFNVTALLRGDSKTRSEYYRTLMTLGVLSLNDVRDLEGFNPIPEGDVHLVQGAMETLPNVIARVPKAENPAPASMSPPQVVVVSPALTEPQDDGLSGLNQIGIDIEAAVARHAGETQAAIESLKVLGHAQETRETALTASARQLLQSAIGRMIRKHAQAARRASKAPGEWLAWNDGFGDKNRAGFVDELSPCLDGLKLLGVNATPADIVEWHLQAAHAELLAASDVTADRFAESVETCVAKWESERAAELTARAFGGGE